MVNAIPSAPVIEPRANTSSKSGTAMLPSNATVFVPICHMCRVRVRVV
jgi:hypothetical protein